MGEDRRREIGLFRYTLIRDAADPCCRRRSAAGWSARSPSEITSGLTGGWFTSRAARWISGSVRIAAAGLTRSFPSLALSFRTRRLGCSSWRSRSSGNGRRDRGAGPSDHAHHRRGSAGAGVADVADAPGQGGVERPADGRSRGRSMAASKRPRGTSCGRRRITRPQARRRRSAQSGAVGFHRRPLPAVGRVAVEHRRGCSARGRAPDRVDGPRSSRADTR